MPSTTSDTQLRGTFEYKAGHACQIIGLPAIYERAFGVKPNGTFVEIGAYDGETYSNTSGLADGGWRGIYVEPVPELAEKTRVRHASNNVVVVESAVGRASGSLDLFVDGTASTANQAAHEAFRKLCWGVHDNKITVKCTTLNDLLVDNNVAPGFELLVVDVEGGEADVFAGFDLALWRPTMIIVELADVHPDFSKFEDVVGPAAMLRRSILSAGYVEDYVDHINTVFVKA